MKLSSEDAGAVAITQVVSQQIELRELMERMLAAVGKDAHRIAELLRRGTLVSGATRYRWTGIEAAEAEIAEVLRSFPDPDPSRAFEPAQCLSAVLRGGGQRIEITREAASKRRLFRRESFWDALLAVAAGKTPAYLGYGYRERADRYEVRLSVPDAAALRSASGLLAYRTLEEKVRTVGVEGIEFVVRRD